MRSASYEVKCIVRRLALRSRSDTAKKILITQISILERNAINTSAAFSAHLISNKHSEGADRLSCSAL